MSKRSRVYINQFNKAFNQPTSQKSGDSVKINTSDIAPPSSAIGV